MTITVYNMMQTIPATNYGHRSAELPLHFQCTLEAELPTSNLQENDTATTEDTCKRWRRTGAAWVANTVLDVIAVGLMETGGPTGLVVGSIPDGTYGKRVGNTFVGAAIAGGGDMLKSDNLLGLANYPTARTNMGLGTAAITAATDYATAAQGTTADAALQPAGNGGSLTGLTKTQVGLANAENTSDAGKPVSTATQTALNGKQASGSYATGAQGSLADTALQSVANNASYRTVKYGAGSHIAAKAAGNYVFPPGGGVMAVGGTGTLYPQQVFFLTGADFPTVNGLATKLRIKGSVFCNDVAPHATAITFTFGLHPITRPSTSGGAGVCIYTVGTVVTGSNGGVVTTPAADTSTNAIGADFAIPADGWYALVCVTSATIATSAHTHLTCELQMRNP